jgi:hypothetical protein
MLSKGEGQIRNTILKKSYKFTEKIFIIIFSLCVIGKDSIARRGLESKIENIKLDIFFSFI